MAKKINPAEHVCLLGDWDGEELQNIGKALSRMLKDFEGVALRQTKHEGKVRYHAVCCGARVFYGHGGSPAIAMANLILQVYGAGETT